MPRRKTRTDVDREVTAKGVTKFMAGTFGALLLVTVIVNTWPVSGVVLALGLVAALVYFRNKRG